MKKYTLTTILLIFASAWSQSSTAELEVDIDPTLLLDPRNRDEDITNTVITVDWEMLSDGNYAYNYSIETKPENKGTIHSFSIDVSCETPSKEPIGYPALNSFSNDEKHIVIATDNPNYENISGPVITAKNRVHWLVLAGPGELNTGARIISKEAPVERTYTLEPVWDSANWAYALYEGDATVPWIDDFIVTGTTIAPRCSTDTSPIPGSDPGSDPGGDPGSDCQNGNAYGHDKGKGHEISRGLHKGHEHDCE